MEFNTLIPAELFCLHHQVTVQFVEQLSDQGLFILIKNETGLYIPEEAIGPLERMVRLHRDLDINPEGIATISFLIEKIQALEKKLLLLNKQLPSNTED